MSFSSPAGGDPTWDIQILFRADPAVFATVRATSSGGTVGNNIVYNTALGASQPLAVAAMVSSFEHWRVAYAGATIHLVAPSVSNQGTVVAAQYPIRYSELGNSTSGSGLLNCLYPFIRYNPATAEPVYADLIKMPNAYVGEAKDGLYMPLKLESNHIRWRDEGCRRLDASGWAASSVNQTLTVPTASAGTYPWPNLTIPAYISASVWYSDVCLTPANDIVGGICFRGLSNAASLSLTLREGFEVRCVPGSAFTSFLKVSPEHDLMAMTNYYKIARQLKDAYPVEYNDLGKLWDLIKGAARVVSPLISLVPGGNMLRGAAGVLGKIGDAAFSKSDKAGVLSATDIERMRKQVAQRLGQGGTQKAPAGDKPAKPRRQRGKKAPPKP